MAAICTGADVVDIDGGFCAAVGADGQLFALTVGIDVYDMRRFCGQAAAGELTVDFAGGHLGTSKENLIKSPSL